MKECLLRYLASDTATDVQPWQQLRAVWAVTYIDAEDQEIVLALEVWCLVLLTVERVFQISQDLIVVGTASAKDSLFNWKLKDLTSSDPTLFNEQLVRPGGVSLKLEDADSIETLKPLCHMLLLQGFTQNTQNKCIVNKCWEYIGADFPQRVEDGQKDPEACMQGVADWTDSGKTRVDDHSPPGASA